jgi:aspartyl protease family protein
MRNSSMPSLALAMSLTLAAGLPGLRPLADSVATVNIMALTEIKGGENGHYFVRASINNQQVDALVDTGASAVALSYEDADRVGLRPRNLDYTVPVATANGMAKAAKVKLSRVEIDNVRVDDVDAYVMPQGALNGTLLGMSFLSRLTSFKSEGGTLTLKN